MNRDHIVRVILDTFDRFMSSEHRDDGFLDIFMGRFLGTTSYSFDGYGDGGVRGVLEAMARGCSDDELQAMDKTASDLGSWIEGWEVQHDYAAMTQDPNAIDDVDYEKLGLAFYIGWKRFNDRVAAVAAKPVRKKRQARSGKRRAR